MGPVRSAAMAQGLTAADEHPHAPGDDRDWAEWWRYEFVAPDASLGGQVQLVLLPGHGVAWYGASVVGRGRAPVVVVADDLALPRKRSLELRAEGLWADHIVEDPFDHISVGLEAFGLIIDGLGPVTADELGLRTPIGLDLGWETDGPVRGAAAEGGYDVPCQVVGEILLEDGTIQLDGLGWRSHRWGVFDRWPPRWSHTRGRLDDGTWFLDDLAIEVGDGVGPTVPSPTFLPLAHPQATPFTEAVGRFREESTGRMGVGWATFEVSEDDRAPLL